MQITRGSVVLSLGLFLLVACSGGDTTGGRTPGLGGGGPRATGSGASKAPSTAGAAGAFGNTNKPVTTGGQTMPDAGCTDGMRCYTHNEADTKDCGHQTLSSSVKMTTNPGNVLLVFDTSGSMNDNWDGGSSNGGATAKWQIAGDAIKNALMPLQDLLTVGTIFFPRADPNAPTMCVDPTGIACIFVPGLMAPGGTCGVTPITSNDQINFAPGPQFLMTFAGPGGNATPPYAPVPGGRTPLTEGLQQAQAALASATLTGITTVIIITDGDPNCQWDEAASTKIVSDWLTLGIKTYAFGVPGVGGMGQTILNNLAKAGGTDMYIPASDPMALQTKLGEIVSQTVTQGIDTCTIDLKPPAEVPDKLHLVVTMGGKDQDVARSLGKNAGWSVTTDGATVTLQGTLCDQAKAGAYEQLRFDFGCVDLPPLPPPPPVPE